MTGKIGVLQTGMPVDLNIKANNAQPLVSKLVTANLNADLHVSGTARERLDIAGKVHLNRTLIGIPNSLPPNVAVLDVRRRGKPAPRGARAAIGHRSRRRRCDAPQEFLVQGRGLDAEMGGELHIGGTTDSPPVSGDFDLIPAAGVFRSRATGSASRTGRVSFNGAGLQTKIDPTLDFTAQATVADTTAAVAHHRSCGCPAIRIHEQSGEAAGRNHGAYCCSAGSARSSRALQLAQIGAALASLSGVGGDGGLNPLVKLQKSLGLDRLTLGVGRDHQHRHGYR